MLVTSLSPQPVAIPSAKREMRQSSPAPRGAGTAIIFEVIVFSSLAESMVRELARRSEQQPQEAPRHHRKCSRMHRTRITEAVVRPIIGIRSSDPRLPSSAVLHSLRLRRLPGTSIEIEERIEE
jgi:hypothetical protein